MTDDPRLARLAALRGAPSQEDPVLQEPFLKPETLYGPVGEFAEAVAPFTEAHRAAIYASALAYLGALIGPGPRFYQGAYQKTNLFICTIGLSGTGRKTAGLGIASQLLFALDPAFAKMRVVQGNLSSGEGVLELVRDPERDKDGNITRGTDDQRLVLVVPELANMLKTGQRAGNTLADIVRQAWDPHTLHVTRRNDPAVASHHHISILANVTAQELFRTASSIDYEGGLLNRFMFLYARPERSIARPKPVPPDILTMVPRLRSAIERARQVAQVSWPAEGVVCETWERYYNELYEQRLSGRVGDLLSRRDTHPIRVAFLLALLDGKPMFDEVHLNAAISLQEYSEDTIAYCWERWGTAEAVESGAYLAHRAHAASSAEKIFSNTEPGQFLSVTDLRRLFGNKRARQEIEQLMETLVRQGLFKASDKKPAGGGKTAQGWERIV